MKKRFGFLLVVLALSGFLFQGSSLAGSAKPKDWPPAISISTPPVATGAYGVNVALCSLISKYLDVPCTVEGTPGDRAGITILAKKEAEFTNASALPAWEAYRGIGEFTQLGKTPLRLVAGCHAVYIHLAALEGSGINSIEDIRGKRFMYYNPGAVLLYTSAEAILDAYGLKGDVKVLKTAGLKPSIDALIEGRADVIAYPSGLGAGPFIELAATKPTRFLPVSRAAIDKIQEKSPFFSGEALPAGTYKGQDKEVLCLALRASTVTRADVPESLVYSVVKTLWDHLDEFKTLHTAAKEWALEDILDLRVIPWHPGVIRYYKERGLWTADLDKAQEKLLSEGK